MDETTATAMAAAEASDETVVKNFTRFQGLLSTTEIFALDNVRLRITHDIGIASIPMTAQYMMDYVIEELQDITDVKILYSCRTPDGSRRKLVAYSMPYNDEMYIISMQSEQYGIVEQMDMTFFESLDVMLSWLRTSLISVEGKEEELDIVEIQSMTDLYRNFI